MIEKKLNLNKRTISNLKVRELSAAKGGRMNALHNGATGDTCLCGPTFWEGCQ
ncbi:MAG: hypothetical protein GY765_16835 [bacterium]|nr:hypothetical protein [bacterium]